MRHALSRNAWISLFTAVWIAVFHYETLRLNYLSPLVLRLSSGQVGRELPKLKFLYPPAGWIMFFNVDRRYGFAEVYSVSGDRPARIDPHEIFSTRFVGYDNIHRNVLISVLSRRSAPAFCRYLDRKFPHEDSFLVVYAEYPDLVDQPQRVERRLAYRCE